MYLIHQWISSVSQIKMRLPGPAPISTPVFLVGCLVDSLWKPRHLVRSPTAIFNCQLFSPIPPEDINVFYLFARLYELATDVIPSVHRSIQCQSIGVFLGQLGMLICNGVRTPLMWCMGVRLNRFNLNDRAAPLCLVRPGDESRNNHIIKYLQGSLATVGRLCSSAATQFIVFLTSPCTIRYDGIQAWPLNMAVTFQEFQESGLIYSQYFLIITPR